MHLIIQHDTMVPIYEQLVQQIKEQIIRGKLHEGEALLSTRTLAKDLKISALTVKKAYDILDEEGFITTVHGKGSFVSAINPAQKQEERLQEIERDLEALVAKCRLYDVSEAQLQTLLQLVWEDIS